MCACMQILYSIISSITLFTARKYIDVFLLFLCMIDPLVFISLSYMVVLFQPFIFYYRELFLHSHTSRFSFFLYLFCTLLCIFPHHHNHLERLIKYKILLLLLTGVLFPTSVLCTTGIKSTQYNHLCIARNDELKTACAIFILIILFGNLNCNTRNNLSLYTANKLTIFR